MPTDEMTTPVTKGELNAALEIWGGALLARIDDVRREIIGEVGRMLRDELAQAVLSFGEWTASNIRALDDKYRDLPARVTRLEAKVFPPRRARRR